MGYYTTLRSTIPSIEHDVQYLLHLCVSHRQVELNCPSLKMKLLPTENCLKEELDVHSFIGSLPNFVKEKDSGLLYVVGRTGLSNQCFSWTRSGH